MSLKVILAVVFLIGSISTNVANADRGEGSIWLKDDHFKISLGTFLADYESDFRISSSALGIGTRVSFEDDLGLDDSDTVFRVDGYYRFFARHRFDLSYVDLSRDGKTTTRFPIIIDDTFFPTGSKLATEFDYQVLKAAYAYSFVQTDKVDVSVSGGLYLFDFDLNVVSEDGKREGEDGIAPMPMVGLHLNYRLTDKLFLTTSYEYFSIDDDDVEGELTDGRISFEYRAMEHLGFGVGYNAVSIDGEDTEDHDELVYDYEGVMAYLSWNF
jgi:hypothetical protein